MEVKLNMEIRAKVALSLPNKFYKVVLKYDTFEKATYDSYLVASIVANAKNEKDAIEYIDEITGNGSLNPHFKKLYEEISKMTKEQVEGILKNSLYPITVVDKSHHFKYYEMFDATRMDNKVFPGNLENNPNLANMLMPKDRETKFLSLEFETEDGTVKKDNYNAIFSEKEIKVDLDDGQYYPISKENFLLVFDNEGEVTSEWMPKVGYEITAGNWNVLTKGVADTWGKDRLTYKTEEDNLAVLLNDCIKETEVITAYDLLFYKETRYNFSDQNQKKCLEAVRFLKDSKMINEYKTRSLIVLLSVIPDIYAQQIVQYILTRKNSKEIAEFGLMLIKGGLEKGWEKEVLLSIKNSIPQREYKYLYKINSDLNFEVTDLLDIDDADLVEADKMRKRAYVAERDNLIKEIKLMIGDMTTSGVRQKLKSLQKDSVVNSVKKFLNEYQGHNEGELENMSLEEIKKEYETIKAMYNGNYAKVKERCDKLEDK